MLYASIIIAIISSLPRSAEADVACNETHNPCEELLWSGSKCQDGFCTNPFQGGCLRGLLGSEEYENNLESSGAAESLKTLRRRLLSKPRVCNSEDGPDVIERGLCVKNEAEYPEVRIYSQNWESAFVLSWIMQVIYSELLGVPSTIESGMADKNVNFYDESNRMEYGSSYDKSVIENAHQAEGGDCTIYKGEDEYSPCAHLVMDIWNNGWDGLVESGVAETLKLVGMIGYQGWYITNFSIKRDPSLANHYGLSGEENRQKLAEAFKRPTTWGYYCTLVSPNNCAVDDGVAKRAPAGDGSEDGLFFSSGFYTGHFRATGKNDCDTNPTTCTGHILDLPCDWTSYVKQQTKHLGGGIALESDGTQPSGGYTYGELVDIWSAANATKSDVIGVWWAPDVTVSMFSGSGSDLSPVSLPTTTQECLKNRVDLTKRCEPDATEFDLYGDSKGACGENPVTTLKVAVENMQSNINTNSNPTAQMSPAYEVYEAFTFRDVEVDGILTDWISREVDKDNFDLRFATCKWMADNLDLITKSFIPPSHPRTLVLANNSGLTIAAYVFSAIALLLNISTAGGITYTHRKGTLERSSQIMFLYLLQAGFFMVTLGGLLLALEASTGSCVASIWLIQVGYTVVVVPTLIRVSTIIKIVKDSMKMKTVKVDKKKMFRRSIGISGLAAIYCLFWTIFDTPHSQASVEVTGDQNEFGETIVEVSHYCDSGSDIWYYVSFVIQSLLLLSASVLAYQMRSCPNSVNDSKPLALMIYSSFFFLTLRFVVYVVAGLVTEDSQSIEAPLQKVRSIFCSVDSMTNILIFFTRFFVKKETKKKTAAVFKAKSARFFANNIAQREANSTAVTRFTENSARTLADPHQSGSSDNPQVKFAEGESFSDKSSTRPRVKFAEEKKIEYAEEEKEEEEDKSEVSSSTVRIKMKEKSIDVPKWVLEEYGSDITDEHEGWMENANPDNVTR